MGSQLYRARRSPQRVPRGALPLAARARPQGPRGLRARRRAGPRDQHVRRERDAPREARPLERRCGSSTRPASRSRARPRAPKAFVVGAHRAVGLLPRRGARPDDRAKVRERARPSRPRARRRRRRRVCSSRPSARRTSSASPSRARSTAAGGKIPVIASASVDERSRMADGTPSAEIARLMREWGASVVGVNCCDGPMNVLEAVEPMLELGLPVWAVPNAGLPRRVDDRLVYVSTPEYFGVFARRMFKLGVRLVGGCCGTTPEHVRRIAAAARMAGAAERGASATDDPDGAARTATRRRSRRGRRIRRRGADAATCVPLAERSEPRREDRAREVRRLGRGQPAARPRSRRRRSRAAKMLMRRRRRRHQHRRRRARAGAHGQPRARVARRRSSAGSRRILHVCGRDRNLLGTLAHLLGAHELGVRNLVIITGDPPKMGDFPDATAVYDLDSIGLLQLAARLNRGVDPGGKPLGGATRVRARHRRRARRAQLRARARAARAEEGGGRRARA